MTASKICQLDQVCALGSCNHGLSRCAVCSRLVGGLQARTYHHSMLMTSSKAKRAKIGEKNTALASSFLPAKILIGTGLPAYFKGGCIRFLVRKCTLRPWQQHALPQPWVHQHAQPDGLHAPERLERSWRSPPEGAGRQGEQSWQPW